VGEQYDAPEADLGRVLAMVGAAAVLLTVAIVIEAAWKSSFYDAVLPVGIFAVIIGLQAALSSSSATRVPAEAAVRTPQERLDDDGLDPPSRALLRRAQDAIRAVTSSEVCRADLLDRAAVSTALAGQESDITWALHGQARIRARRAGLTPASAGPMTAAVSTSQMQAERAAESSLAARVEALERYAAEVAMADAAYRDWRQAARLAELHGQHLDMLARTAADEHGIAEIETMSQQARAVTHALREPGDPGSAAQQPGCS
jgi:hypothetical protein